MIVSIPYRFNESPHLFSFHAQCFYVSIPYRFNERFISFLPTPAPLQFQFLIGSMKEELRNILSQKEFAVSIPYRFNERAHLLLISNLIFMFQFLIGSMKGRGDRCLQKLFDCFNSL